jgi:formiminotetrahydrofolate cyclodeaminase
MKNLTIKEFAELTASKSAVPGGGSVSALCGGLAAALTEMVANLTIGNKKYPKAELHLCDVPEKAARIRMELLEHIKKDSDAYMQVMNAYKLPKGTKEKKDARADAIQESLKTAATVPMEIASLAYEVLKLSKVVVEHGNKNAVTDGMVSALLARSSALGALMNVKINLGLIKDHDFVANMIEKADSLQDKCNAEEKNILNGVKL